MSITGLEAVSRAFGAILFGIVLRSTVFFLASAVVIFFLRSRTAEIRHLIWRGVLYGLLLLPVIEFTAPPIRHSTPILIKAEMTLFPSPPVSGKDEPVRAAPFYQPAPRHANISMDVDCVCDLYIFHLYSPHTVSS